MWSWIKMLIQFKLIGLAVQAIAAFLIGLALCALFE